MEPEFKTYWDAHREQLLHEDPEYKEALSFYSMKGGRDWFQFFIPILAGIVTIQVAPVSNELIRFAICVVVILLTTVLVIYIKSALSPHRPLSDIEKDVRERVYNKWRTSNNSVNEKKT